MAVSAFNLYGDRDLPCRRTYRASMMDVSCFVVFTGHVCPHESLGCVRVFVPWLETISTTGTMTSWLGRHNLKQILTGAKVDADRDVFSSRRQAFRGPLNYRKFSACTAASFTDSWVLFGAASNTTLTRSDEM
jgi:hypothetical protein